MWRPPSTCNALWCELCLFLRLLLTRVAFLVSSILPPSLLIAVQSENKTLTNLNLANCKIDDKVYPK